MFSVFPEVSFPGGASVKEPACQCRRYKRCMFDPWVRKIPGKATHSSILVWRIPWTEEPHRLRNSHGVSQSWTQLKWLSMHSRLSRVRALLYMAELQAWVSLFSKKNMLLKYLDLLKFPVSGVAMMDTTEKQEALGQVTTWEKYLGEHPTWKELLLHPVCGNKAF